MRLKKLLFLMMRDVMMRKIPIIFIGLMLLFSPLGHAEETSVPSKVLDHEEDYIVKEGDTLWDISQRFYNDAFLWPRLWHQNQYITNPHHIYPGDRIRLYPYKVLIELEETKPPPVGEVKPVLPPTEEAPLPLPPPPEIIRLVIYPEVRSAGFIAGEKKEMEGIGRVVEAKEGKLELVEEDEVYINFQRGISPQKGDQFIIFRVGDPIKHPVFKMKMIGRKVQILGRATIIATKEGRAQTALITSSYDSIVRGDVIVPYFPPQEELAIRRLDRPAYGWVVASKLPKLGLVEGDVVYIDQGEENHIQPGHLFDVFRRGAVVRDPVSEEKVKLPDEPIARMVIISSQRKTATAVILHSRLSVYVGDEIMAVTQ
jgi:hypothetical protein